MATYSAKPAQRPRRKPRKGKVADVAPAPARFVSFRYSSTQLTLVDGRTRIKSQQARFQGGKLESEAFEGELDRTVYDEMVRHAERYFLGTIALFLPFRD
jgi:hypothetical protein